MEIRELTIDDLPQVNYIAQHAFYRGIEPDIGAERFMAPNRHRIGVFENGRLQASASIIGFNMYFGDEVRPCGGIAGVMTDPSSRGRGYAGKLMTELLGIMKDKGQYLSSLWPFSFKFYQGYGWDWTGQGLGYKMPLRTLHSDPEASFMEGVYDNVPEVLNPIYESLAQRYNGALVRNDERWKEALEPWEKRSPAFYVYRRDGRAEGYAILRFTEKKDELFMSDFAALTMRAYRGILGLLHRHAMTIDNVKWSAPADDPLWSIIADWDVKSKLEYRGMGRIVDVAAALQAIKPSSSLTGSVVIAVKDPHASWNEGAWEITADGGLVQVKRSQSEPAIELDIRALTQAYWGTPSLTDLRKWERLVVYDEAGFGFLAELLPGKVVWLGDDF